MVHQYQLNGYHIVLDSCSGSIHVVDEVAYDVIALYEHKSADEIVAELLKNFKADFKLVATGGFARWALRDLDLPFTVDPTLTLYGAGLIANARMRTTKGETGRKSS